MSVTTAAFLGAVGGAGTTRTTLEVAALLAADGADVAVLDAAYGTQGLARYLPGRLDPDLTALVTDAADVPLADAGVVPDWDLPGRLVCYPAHAPFERLARAKAPAAAQALAERAHEAAADSDHVLLDVPPLAANQAVAAVHAADRVAIVAPATMHGMDAVQTTRDRLRDVDAVEDGPSDDADRQADGDAAVALVQQPGHAGHLLGRSSSPAAGVVEEADVVLPRTPLSVPASVDDPAYGRACAELASVVLDREVDLAFEGEGLLGGRLGSIADIASIRKRVRRGTVEE